MLVIFGHSTRCIGVSFRFCVQKILERVGEECIVQDLILWDTKSRNSLVKVEIIKRVERKKALMDPFLWEQMDYIHE